MKSQNLATHRIITLKQRFMLFARWIVVLCLSLDMVSSPLHGHHHEGGPEPLQRSAGTFHDHAFAVAEAEAADDNAETHETAAKEKSGHSVSAVRTIAAACAIESTHAADFAQIQPWLELVDFVVAASAELPAAWPTMAQEVLLSSPPLLRPESRAPPFLHA